ncbi:putative uncharacterized protein [Clostridium sp. CAG:590]|nr:putative uncharacterized protein [Clostridium sp. CAG:590]
MGLLSTVKDLFTKTEVTEEVFEYESIDSYLKKQQQEMERKGTQDDVAYKCDQIVEASYQMEDLRAEYDMVTSYFEDIQMIEELPQNVRKQVTDIAKKIAFLERETSQFVHMDDRISDENFRMIQGMEKDLTTIFGQLKELEDMDMVIRRDMTNLEGEKNAQEYIQESIEQRQHSLKNFIIIFGTISVLVVLTLVVIGIMTKNNLVIPVLLILLIIAGMAAFSVIIYRRLSYEFKMAEKRENRAISLMNKVKIKYVNNTSTLEYLYAKYHVNSLRELEYLHDQYLIMVDEVRKYQQTTGDLREHTDALSKLLYAHGIKDPDIWTKQSLALIDPREMVEVKHSLNVRRQKLREQLAYNEQLRLDGLKDIREMLKTNPELREKVRREMEVYHINIQ